MLLSFLLGKSYVLFNNSKKDNNKEITENPIIFENEEYLFDDKQNNDTNNDQEFQETDIVNGIEDNNQINEELPINDSENINIENSSDNNENNNEYTESEDNYNDENIDTTGEQSADFEDESSVVNTFEENDSVVESGDIVPENNSDIN